MMPPPYPPPCSMSDATALFAGLGLSTLTGGLLAHYLVITLPRQVRACRLRRLRRLNPPKRSV